MAANVGSHCPRMRAPDPEPPFEPMQGLCPVASWNGHSRGCPLANCRPLRSLGRSPVTRRYELLCDYHAASRHAFHCTVDGQIVAGRAKHRIGGGCAESAPPQRANEYIDRARQARCFAERRAAKRFGAARIVRAVRQESFRESSCLLLQEVIAERFARFPKRAALRDLIPDIGLGRLDLAGGRRRADCERLTCNVTPTSHE